nr:hypothetical protein [uncultured Sphingomonas sp.]
MSILQFGIVFSMLGSAQGAVQSGTRPVVKVAAIESDSDCTLYESYWGTWLVIECQKQFRQLREGLQSALVETGQMSLSTSKNGVDVPRPNLVVSGRVQGLGFENSRTTAAGYCVAGTRVKGSLDLRVREAGSNRVIHAVTVSRSVEVSGHVVAGGGSCSSSNGRREHYDLLQRELALTAARTLAFKIQPLRVSGSQGRMISLNYGSPLLKLGTILQVMTASGIPAKYRVTGTLGGQSYASPMGVAGTVAPGAPADVLDEDDPQALGRRFERVEL